MPLKAYTEQKTVISYLKNIERLIFDKDIDIENEVRRLYPSDYDQDNIEAENFFINRFDGSILKLYKVVSNQLFTNINGHITLKSNRLAEYNFYTTQLDTYPFFTTKLLEISKDLIDKKQRLNYIIAHIDESFSFDGNLEEILKEISDNHIHLGASNDFHYRVSDVLKEPYKYSNYAYFNKNEHSLDITSRMFKDTFFIFFSLIETLLIGVFLNIDESFIKLNKLWKLMQSFIKKKKPEYYIKKELYKLYNSISSIRKDSFFKNYFDNEADEFRRDVLIKAYQYFNVKSEIYNPKLGDKLLVTYLIDSLYIANKISFEYKVLQCYFVMRNIFKVIIFQQHRRSGFSYFSSYSKNRIKKETNRSLNQIFNSVYHPNIKTNIEFRVSIDNSAQELSEWVDKIDKEFKKFNSEGKYRLKLLFHYIKEKEKSSYSNIDKYKIKFQDNRVKYKKKSKVLSDFLTDRGFRYKNKNIDLAYKYFHGIDCAGNELYTPPEVFAPIYRFFKTSILSSGFAISKDVCNELPEKINLQYSYHVGEEFRDIISGVRAIFEAIIFLDLKNEDRLGHAIALGINPQILFADRSRISLSKGEYMDNLVFLYYIFSMSKEPPYSLEKIRNIIIQLGNEIYGKISNKIERTFEIDDYIAAWLLRRNCPVAAKELIDKIEKDKICNKLDSEYELAWHLKEYLQKNSDISYNYNSFEKTYLKASLPDFIYNDYTVDEPLGIYLGIRNNIKAYILYWAYETNLVSKSYEEPYLDDVIFPYDVYEFLQDFIMEKFVSDRDLVIEILPTSNVLISSLRSYDEHHFVRFYPPKDKNIEPNNFGLRKKKIRIVLGTDDPGIQGTNLMMEYHIIHEIISKKYSKRIADDYVKKLAEFGNIIFNKGSGNNL